jgi:hypothetical protein
MRVTPAHRSENKTSKYKVKAWHSINDFIEAYYNEPTCPSQSLQDQTGYSFLTVTLLIRVGTALPHVT